MRVDRHRRLFSLAIALFIGFVSLAAGLSTVDIPFVGEFDPEEYSLVLSTLLIGLVDGFNPCSLWILIVLIGLVAHAGREKFVVVGATFLLVTAGIYGLFIAGVLSIFTFIAHLDWIRYIVAAVAFVFAGVALSDFVALGRGLSFSIPEQAKPGIYRRIRRVIRSDGWLSTIGATALLAGGVALIELPCTAGFPLIWSNLVAVHDLSAIAYGGLVGTYLLAYLAVEIIILVVVGLAFVSVTYTEYHGRVLKLLAGIVMLALGVVVLVDPFLLENVGATAAVIGGAVVLTVVIALFDRVRFKRTPE